MVVCLENLPRVRGEPAITNLPVDWLSSSFNLSRNGTASVESHNDVTSFVYHRAALDASAIPERKRGHYVAFVKKNYRWFELDDSLVTELPHLPTAWPWSSWSVMTIVLLTILRKTCSFTPRYLKRFLENANVPQRHVLVPFLRSTATGDGRVCTREE